MMRLNKSNGERGYLSPFLWLFLFVGIILSLFVEGGDNSYESMFESGGIADVKAGNFSEKGFFMHILILRLSYMVTLILLSTTALRKLFLMMQPLLLSMGIGSWIGAAISQFGMKGILLVLAGVFPHMLLYFLILRFLLMVLWERTYFDKQFFIAIFILFFMAIIGCLLESYVNPMIVAKIIKIL